MTKRQSIGCVLVALLLFIPAIALSQNAVQTGTLIVNGQSAGVPVIQMNGRSYVELEGLARAVNGSLSFHGSRTTLTLPGASATPPPASHAGFSKAFLRAGIEQMATIREWHSALATAIQSGIPVTADWLGAYRAQATTNLNLASLAASTDSDHSGYQLLSTEFQNMGSLSDKYIAKRANLDFVAPDALQNDDLNQRIVACGHSLASIAASGQFVDDGSCH
jgi:hypothetical protein